MPGGCRVACTGVCKAEAKWLLTVCPSTLPQAQAWMGWEMAVGFRRLNQLQVWDGRRWSQEDMPGGKRASPPRGRPRGSSPSAAQSNGVSTVAHQNGAPAAVGNGARGATLGSNGSAAGVSTASQSEPSPSAANPSPSAAARKPWEAARSAPRPVAGANAGPSQLPASSGGAAATSASAAASTPTAAGASNSSSGSATAQNTATAQDGAKGQGTASGALEAKADVPAMVAQPLLECHYSLHGAFLAEPLLEVRSLAALCGQLRAQATVHFRLLLRLCSLALVLPAGRSVAKDAAPLWC